MLHVVRSTPEHLHGRFHRSRNLDSLQRGVMNAWQSFDLSAVNGNAVRLRVMQDVTANWHTHETNKTAMRLYDYVATHSGFVVYRKDI